jgi:hypothetical protein
MNSNNRISQSKNRTKEATAAIPMVGAIVTAALLLSGLSLIGSYQQPVIAQEELLGGGGATTGGGTEGGTTGGNATTTGLNQTTASEVILHLDEVRTALQNDDTESALMHLDLALNALGSAGALQGNTTTGTTIAGTDVTDTSNEDGAPSVGGTSAADEGSQCGGVTVGGTSAADDYGCPPDPDT